jgi:DNA-directed RNA polymerase subunit RPC12/RpoP|nr:MAG TPA: Trm112p-like protein [Caudoviricetes sp.]
MTAKYIKMGVEEWYTEVYKCISCSADTMMVMNERYRQPRFCANCGAAFTQEENDERSK